MPDRLTSDQRHRNMAAIHSAATNPELRLRHALWHLGFRYRVNVKRLPGSPDIVLAKYKTVIFVHGCFWHGHKGCKNYTIPKTNTEFWTAKIARNQERDQETWRQLEAKGWTVIVVWECELEKGRLEETVASVAAEIRRNGESLQQALEYRHEVQKAYRQERLRMKEKKEKLAEELKKVF